MEQQQKVIFLYKEMGTTANTLKTYDKYTKQGYQVSLYHNGKMYDSSNICALVEPEYMQDPILAFYFKDLRAMNQDTEDGKWQREAWAQNEIKKLQMTQEELFSILASSKETMKEASLDQVLLYLNYLCVLTFITGDNLANLDEYLEMIQTKFSAQLYQLAQQNQISQKRQRIME